MKKKLTFFIDQKNNRIYCKSISVGRFGALMENNPHFLNQNRYSIDKTKSAAYTLAIGLNAFEASLSYGLNQCTQGNLGDHCHSYERKGNI